VALEAGAHYVRRKDMPPHPLQRSATDVVAACLRAHGARDWDRLRELFHTEARIGVFAGGGHPADPEQAIADMKRSYEEDDVYDAYVTELHPLDEQAVILHGRVRRRTGSGFIDVERTWLYVVRDDRLYRSAVFRSEDEARRAYDARGPSLGA